MTKQDTRRLLDGAAAPSTDTLENILKVFEDHFRLAAKTMKPEAALHTAYTAASNLIVSRKPERSSGGAARDGVKAARREGVS